MAPTSAGEKRPGAQSGAEEAGKLVSLASSSWSRDRDRPPMSWEPHGYSSAANNSPFIRLRSALRRVSSALRIPRPRWLLSSCCTREAALPLRTPRQRVPTNFLPLPGSFRAIAGEVGGSQ